MHRVPARKEHFNLIISTISEVGVKKCLPRLIIKILLEERGKNTWRHRVEQIVSILLYHEESVYSKYLEEAGSYFRLPSQIRPRSFSLPSRPRLFCRSTDCKQYRLIYPTILITVRQYLKGLKLTAFTKQDN